MVGVGVGCAGPGATTSPPPAVAKRPAPNRVQPAKRGVSVPPRPSPVLPDKTMPACAPFEKKIAAAYAPYVNAYSNLVPEISKNGRWLLFRSTRGGGSPQLYLARARQISGKPRKIAFAKDRVGGARFTPDGQGILFVRDKSHNENWQIFWSSLDGKTIRNLTKAPDKFHQLPKVSPDGRTLYYFRGVRKKSAYELVSQPVKGGSAQVLLRGKGFHFISDLSPDGKTLLVVNWKMSTTAELWSVDVKSGSKKLLAPKAGAKAQAYGVFAPGGKQVYVVTDEGTPRTHLRRLDLATGKITHRLVTKTGDVHSIAAPKKGRTIAVTVDEGSHHRLLLLDARTLKKKRAVKMALGAIWLGRFAPDNRRVLATVSTPAKPTDVVAVDTRWARVRPLRKEPRLGLKGLGKVKATARRVPTFDGQKVPINVYLPGAIAGRKLPVVVQVHGGPQYASKIRWSPVVSFFVSRGYAVVQPNVRGSTGFGKAWERGDNGRKRMNAIRDLAAVNRWIRGQPWADKSRLVVSGGSYGGYMTYMALGHQPKLWRAGVGRVGVVNLRTFLANTTGAIRLVFRDEFGVLGKDSAFLDSISPIKVVQKFRAPLFVYQGATDPRVPRSEQDQLVAALRAKKHIVEYMVAMDEGHSMGHMHNKLEYTSRVHRFLTKHLGLPGLSPACKVAGQLTRK